MPAIETQAEADEKMVDLPSTGKSVDVKLDDTEKKINKEDDVEVINESKDCLLYTSPSPRDRQKSRMPSSA